MLTSKNMKSLFCLFAVATVAYAGSVKLDANTDQLSSHTAAISGQNIDPNDQDIKQAANARHVRFCEGNSCSCPDGTCTFDPPLKPPSSYVPNPGNKKGGSRNGHGGGSRHGTSYSYDYNGDYDSSEEVPRRGHGNRGNGNRGHGNQHFNGDCDGGKCNCPGGHCSYSV